MRYWKARWERYYSPGEYRQGRSTMWGALPVVIGSYQDRIYEAGTSSFFPDPSVRGIDVHELTELSHLLVDGDHAPRILAGDLCVIATDRLGHPTALQWMNRVTHVDRYLGRWSKPTTETAYVNQTFVDPAHRGMGFGARLMAGTFGLAHELGLARLRFFVDAENVAMHRLCDELGIDQVGSQRGVRLGPMTARLTRVR